MLDILRIYLTDFVGYLQFLLEAISVICILIATLKTLLLMFNNWCEKVAQSGSKIRLVFGNGLATALEFQLAADILITTVEPDTESLIRLAVIAVIRTFLNYFLAKELAAEKSNRAE
ncbi:DUF1622 domain-containing protein [Orbus sturtevantii]